MLDSRSMISEKILRIWGNVMSLRLLVVSLALSVLGACSSEQEQIAQQPLVTKDSLSGTPSGTHAIGAVSYIREGLFLSSESRWVFSQQLVEPSRPQYSAAEAHLSIAQRSCGDA